MLEKFIVKLKAFFIKNNTNKEKSMGEYQGNKLDYKKVQQAFNKAKGTKKDSCIISLRDNLKNFSKKFEDLSKDERQQELNSQKFKQLSKDVNSLNHPELKIILDEMELSELERLSKQVEVLMNKLDTIEKENLQVQGSNIDDIGHSIEDISKIIDDSFWNKLKQSIPTPKLDLSSITQKIDSIKNELKHNKNDINNSNQALSRKIDNIKFPTIPSFPKIPNDYLKKEDFEFTINNKFKDLQEIKESSENLETVPAK